MEETLELVVKNPVTRRLSGAPPAAGAAEEEGSAGDDDGMPVVVAAGAFHNLNPHRDAPVGLVVALAEADGAGVDLDARGDGARSGDGSNRDPGEHPAEQQNWYMSNAVARVATEVRRRAMLGRASS